MLSAQILHLRLASVCQSSHTTSKSNRQAKCFAITHSPNCLEQTSITRKMNSSVAMRSLLRRSVASLAAAPRAAGARALSTVDRLHQRSHAFQAPLLRSTAGLTNGKCSPFAAPLGAARSMFIQTESTPNPHSIKFLPGEAVLDDRFSTGVVRFLLLCDVCWTCVGGADGMHAMGDVRMCIVLFTIRTSHLARRKCVARRLRRSFSRSMVSRACSSERISSPSPRARTWTGMYVCVSASMAVCRRVLLD